jgi:hypothetical protein
MATRTAESPTHLAGSGAWAYPAERARSAAHRAGVLHVSHARDAPRRSARALIPSNMVRSMAKSPTSISRTDRAADAGRDHTCRALIRATSRVDPSLVPVSRHAQVLSGLAHTRNCSGSKECTVNAVASDGVGHIAIR